MAGTARGKAGYAAWMARIRANGGNVSGEPSVCAAPM